MKLKRTVTLLLLLLSLSGYAQDLERYGAEFNEIQRAKDTANMSYFVNSHDVKIIVVDSVEIDDDKVIQRINDSEELADDDQMLVIRILQMKNDPEEKHEALLSTANAFPAIDKIMMEEYHKALVEQFGEKKLDKLKKQKK